MAHYALLDENNIVVQVIVGRNENELGIDWEDFYSKETGLKCKQTSYNTNANVHLLNGKPFRKNYAGIGYKYDSKLDAFIPPQPYSSWILDTNTCTWQPPIPVPGNDKPYYWNEDTMSWIGS